MTFEILRSELNSAKVHPDLLKTTESQIVLNPLNGTHHAGHSYQNRSLRCHRKTPAC